MLCTQCGKESSEGMRFCPNCGNMLLHKSSNLINLWKRHLLPIFWAVLAMAFTLAFLGSSNGLNASTIFFVTLDMTLQAVVSTLVFYPVIWLMIRKSSGKTFLINQGWHVLGLILTTVFAGYLRIVLILTFGGSTGANTPFLTTIPVILSAIVVLFYLRTKVARLE